MAKPMKSLELHYPMIKFLINRNILKTSFVSILARICCFSLLKLNANKFRLPAKWLKSF